MVFLFVVARMKVLAGFSRIFHFVQKSKQVSNIFCKSKPVELRSKIKLKLGTQNEQELMLSIYLYEQLNN